MKERPLLIFPKKTESVYKGIARNITTPHTPTSARQGERLSPKFDQLQTYLKQQKIELQQELDGAEPEQVLVLEVIGSVKDFANAVKKIEGFEFLGEVEIEEILPDADFYYTKSKDGRDEAKDKPLEGNLYAIMTDSKALDHLLSMWNQWKNDDNVQFNHGLGKFKNIFSNLKNIRRWDAQDRLLETEQIWQNYLESYSGQSVTFEIELWFRNSPKKQIENAQQIELLVEDLGGEILNSCIIEEISYHAIIAKLPSDAFLNIVNHSNIKLVKFEGIMFFRPVGQISAGGDISKNEQIESIASLPDHPMPQGNPIVALLDGMPLRNHSLLAKRMTIEDPDDFESQYPSGNLMKHGTSMASLIIHGDLNDNNDPLKHPVYVRPIMQPNLRNLSFGHNKVLEHIPETYIAVDLIHRAIKRIFEGDGEFSASAPSIKIINLSIGDWCRQYTRTMSPWAKLLDWLSAKYNVLIIVSAGNHMDNIDIDLESGQDFESLTEDEREALIVKALYKNSHKRKILSPAESINSITVGSTHQDSCKNFVTASHIFNPFNKLFPSPISAFGNGHRKSIKPDIIFSGGRVTCTQKLDSKNTVLIKDFPREPGNKMCYPGDEVGELDKVVYFSGTSNAAALISHNAAICHDSLKENLQENAAEIDYEKYLPSLIKAMLVHGSSWGEVGEAVQKALDIKDKKIKERLTRKWIGYGMPDIKRVLGCTAQRACVIGFGELKSNESHIFELPLPSSLESKKEWRRVTVTLAWLSPIVATNKKYRQANLWYELPNNYIANDRTDAQWQSVRKGTVQHENFESKKAVSFEDDGTLKIKVNCMNDAGIIKSPIQYALIVSLEVGEGVQISVYDEIRTKLSTKIQVSAAQDLFGF